MKALPINTALIIAFTITTSIAKLHAQNKNLIVNQDPKVEQLLNEKRKNKLLYINK